MTLRKAVEVVTEYQKWRRGKRPYNSDIPVALPYTPAEIGEAEDFFGHHFSLGPCFS